MKPLGIDGMAVTLPALQPVDDLVVAAGLGSDRAKTLRDNGLLAVPVAEPGAFVDFAVRSVEALFAEHPQERPRVRLVLLAHSSPLLCPGDTDLLGALLEHAGLRGAVCFAFAGQPCAVLHTALQWGLDALRDTDEDAALVLGVDRANHPAERLFFGSAMGDASVALLLGRGLERRRIVGAYQDTELHASEGEWSAPAAIQAFRRRNPLLIRSAIEACLERAGHCLDDLAAIVPHTPYLGIWDAMAGLLRYPRHRILTDYIAETGHLSSNDSFVHYHRAQLDGRVRPGDLVLLVNPGFGGSRGCTLIRT